MITIADIRALNPCYDPDRYLPEDWQGTVADILRLNKVPSVDRIWVAVRFIDNKTARLFAVACARRALALVKNPDPRALAACAVAEQYAMGEATAQELAAVRSEAWNAAVDSVVNSCCRHAYASAAWATDDDGMSASWAACAAAARAAPRAAASAAAWDADSAASRAADWSAFAASAMAAERDWQVSKLLELL